MTRAVFTSVVCALCVGFGSIVLSNYSFAQTIKKKKKTEPTFSLAPASNFKPTMTGVPGTVKYYFFPTDTGAWWKMRTVQAWIDTNSKVLRADTLFSESLVVDNKRFSLQRLPLVATSDTSYRNNGAGVRSESVYYVDDSVAMTVFNNSVTNGDNRIFLVAPVAIGNAWHEKLDDTTITEVIGIVDSVATPVGRFDSVVVVLTELEYSDMRKYYAPGRGIVKMVFRSPGPNGRGLVIVTSEMIAFKRPVSDSVK